MNTEAFRLIQECYITKDTYLDLGRLGLTDADFAEGTELDKLLRQCVHLETLVLSYGWNEWVENEWIARSSNNIGPNNHFSVCPPAVQKLKNLVKLIMGGYYNEKWGISDMSFVAGLNKLRYLVLSSNEISKIAGLEGLIDLEELDLRSNKITNIAGLDKLTALKRLDISGNKITEIKELNNLPVLEQLYIGANRITEIRGLDKLTTLKQLFLSGNTIKEIRGLELLTNLEQLTIHHNQISKIKGLHNLHALHVLNLNENQITEIEGLEGLKNLRQLNLSGNQIIEIKGLNNLYALKELYLSGNQISEIKGLETLSALQHLSLVANNIGQIKNIEKLLALEYLDFRGNNISQISGLEYLSKLQNLYLSGNEIKELKGLEFIKDKEAKTLHLHIAKNPLTDKYQLELLPDENHFAFVKDLLLRQEATNKTAIKYPIKVLLLGNHRSGKSSLTDKLTGLKSNGSTHILRIASYTIDKAKAAPGQLPDAVLYDFGGQDFYHGLYRVFIGQDGLQLLLFDTDKDSNGPDKDDAQCDIINFNRHYWLGQKNHTGNTDPYIVVQTHADKPEMAEAKPLDYSLYPGYKKTFFLSLSPKLAGDQKEEEPFYAAGFKYLSTYLNSALRKLQQETQEPQWYVDFWAYIFNKDKNNHLPTAIDEVLKHYKSEQSNPERREMLKRSLTQLHRSGLVLYYDTPELQNHVWLNPEALVQHIQQDVLNKTVLNQKKGVVPKGEFESNILKDKRIRLLLLEQKVIFLHRPTGKEADDEYIIPNYLPLANDTDPDYQLFVFGLGQPDFTIKFNDFIPFGFINQMICFYGLQPDAKKFWRNQVLFTLNKEARVLIQMDFTTLQVKVYIQLIANATVKKDRVASYLFYSLLALYWDKIDFNLLLSYKDYGRKKIFVEIRTKNDTPSSNKKNKLRVFGDENTDDVSTRKMLSNKYDLWEELQENEASVPADAYLSVDGQRFICYKDLFNLQEAYTLKAYLLGIDGRIDITTGKEIAMAPFAPFTHHKIPVMKKIFISYSKHDEEYKEEFRKHLVTLKEQKLISSFNCKEIDLGADWDETIQRELDECDIVICLVSVDFLNTDYIRKYEVEKAMDKGKQVIPIIIKPCYWEPSNIGKLFAPNRGKNISLDQELFLRNIIKETTAIERAAWWVAIVKEMREKLFK